MVKERGRLLLLFSAEVRVDESSWRRVCWVLGCRISE